MAQPQPQRLRFANAQEAVASIKRNHDEAKCSAALDMVHRFGPWSVADLCALSALLQGNALNLADPHEREQMQNGIAMLAREALANNTRPSVAETVGSA